MHYNRFVPFCRLDPYLSSEAHIGLRVSHILLVVIRLTTPSKDQQKFVSLIRDNIEELYVHVPCVYITSFGYSKS